MFIFIRKRKRRRKNDRGRLVAQQSKYGSKKKEILQVNTVPRAEFLLPGRFTHYIERSDILQGKLFFAPALKLS